MRICVKKFLSTYLEWYRSINDTYPDSWQEDMYAAATDDYGPPAFDLDIQSTNQGIQAYAYRYSPLPVGCRDTGCTGYTVTATPEEAGTTGMRAFFLDESGTIRHCTGAGPAAATDPGIDQDPIPCELFN